MSDISDFFAGESTAVDSLKQSMELLSKQDSSKQDSSILPGSKDLTGKQEGKSEGEDSTVNDNWIVPYTTAFGLGTAGAIKMLADRYSGVTGFGNGVKWAAGKLIASDLAFRAADFFMSEETEPVLGMQYPSAQQLGLGKLSPTGKAVFGGGAAAGTYYGANAFINALRQGIQVGNSAQVVDRLNMEYYEKRKAKNIRNLLKKSNLDKPTSEMVKSASKEAREFADGKVDDAAKVLRKQLKDKGVKGIDYILFAFKDPDKVRKLGQWLGKRGKKGLAKKIVAGSVGLVLPEAATTIGGAALLMFAAYDLYGMVQEAPELWKILFEEQPQEQPADIQADTVVEEYSDL